MNWDDLRFFHAVAEHRSLTRAARALNASQPTVGRRIANLEDALGVRLFDRSAQGYTLTGVGKQLVDPVNQIENLAWAIQRRAHGEPAPLRGNVRVSVPHGLGLYTIIPRLQELLDTHTNLTITVMTGSTVADIGRLEADVAVRLFRPPEPAIVARRAATFTTGLYASKRYLRRAGVPQSASALESHAWITFEERLAELPEVQWLIQHMGGQSPSLRSDDVLAQRAAALAGLGIALLPTYLARTELGLVSVVPEAVLPRRTIWVTTHRDLAQVARIAAVARFLHEVLADLG